MKKIYFILIILLSSCVACQWKLAPEDDNPDKPLVEVHRYDRLEYRYLTTGDFSALQDMCTEYPVETRTLLEDVLKLGDATDPQINNKFLSFYQATKLQSMIADVETQYANMDDINRELNAAFTRLKRWSPDMKVPMVYSQIAALDQSVIVGNQAIGISLDKYLGEDYPLYKEFYSDKQRKQMKREYIVADCVSFYLMSLYQLNDFETRPQLERDLHVGKIQWVTNQAINSRMFQSKYVDAVDRYMKKHPQTSYDELLEMTDFSALETAN